MRVIGFVRAIVILCSLASATSAPTQTTVYSHIYDGLSIGNTEPKIVLPDRDGGAAIAGTNEGSFYVRRIDATGHEVWRSKGQHLFYGVEPVKLEWCTNGDVVLMCSISAPESSGILAARLSGDDGSPQWQVTRREGEYVDGFAIGGTAEFTYLLYGSAAGVTVETIANTGLTMWIQPILMATYASPSGTIDNAGQWVVSARSPISPAVIDTVSYSPQGQKSLLHSETIGSNRGVASIIQVASSFVVVYKNGGVYRFTGGMTTWRTPIPYVESLDRVDIEGQILYALTRSNNSVRVNALSLGTGSPLWYKTFTDGISGLGPTPAGNYGYVREGFAKLLTPSGNTIWASPLGLVPWDKTPRGYLGNSGQFQVVARHPIGDFLAELDFRINSDSGQLLNTEVVQVRGNRTFAVRVAPRQDGSAALVNGSDAAQGGGFRLLSEEGVESSQYPFVARQVTAIVDSDGNLVASLALDGSTSIQKLDASGVPLYSIEGYAGPIHAGQDGSVFVSIKRPQSALLKLDRRGRELWRLPMSPSFLSELRDSGSGISFVSKDNQTLLYTTYWLSASGVVTLTRPEIWIVSWKSDGSYYAARRSGSVAPTIEYRDPYHRLKWSRQVPGQDGSGVVLSGHTDRDGNAIFSWRMGSYAWAAASYDSAGNLRWLKRFEGESNSQSALIRGKDLVVVGERPSDANGFSDLAWRIVPNQLGGSDQRGTTIGSWVSCISTDFSGNVYIGGAGGRGRAFVTRVGAVGTRAEITGLRAMNGLLMQGDLSDLAASDDSPAVIQSGTDSDTITVEVQARLPAGSQGELNGIVEHACDRAGMAVEVRMGGNASATWRLVGSAVSDSMDSRILFWSPISEVISTLGELRLQARWRPINDEDPRQDSWRCRLDLVGLHQSP